MFSGVLASNYYVSSHRKIYHNSQMKTGLMSDKVQILSMGLIHEDLFGLLLVQKQRGIAISCDDTDALVAPVKTWKLQDKPDWDCLEIATWFDKCEVKQSEANLKEVSLDKFLQV